MNKSFRLISENKKPERQVEAVKHEIKKYIARERRKDLPEGTTQWNFDCQIGESSDRLTAIKISEINSRIDGMVSEGKEEFYLHLKSTAGHKRKNQE